MINDEHKVNESFDYKEEGELTDKLVAPGFGQWEKGKSENGLSPNPAGSGYTKQVNVSGYSVNDIANPEENVLYILKDGRKFKYLKEHYPHFVRVDYGPNEFKVKGEHGTPVHEVTKPKVTPKVVPYPVHFLDDVKIKGKKLEDYIDSKGGVTEEEMAQYITSVLGTKLKAGYYILDVNNDFIVVQESDIPENYNGIAIEFLNDGFYVGQFVDGQEVQFTAITDAGVDKVNPQALVGLTHSFNELDETLRGIVESAIQDNGASGVDCTEAQWNVIKELLDKSLYLSYNGRSMCKVMFDGIHEYVFGGKDQNSTELVGSTLSFYYNNGKLSAGYYLI